MLKLKIISTISFVIIKASMDHVTSPVFEIDYGELFIIKTQIIIFQNDK